MEAMRASMSSITGKNPSTRESSTWYSSDGAFSSSSGRTSQRRPVSSIAGASSRCTVTR